MSEMVKIDSLDLEGIRENLISTLKKTGRYSDWDFRASGISVLLDLLSQHSYLIGFYVKMALDESFIQSTKTLEGIRAHAESRNFLPNGKKSATTMLKLRAKLKRADDPSRGYISIDRGSTISSANETSDQRIFNVLENINAYVRTEDSEHVYYTTQEFPVYEGISSTWRFNVDFEQQHQRMVIQDHSVDVDTLRVFVKPSEDSDVAVEYVRASDVVGGTKDDLVFYIVVSPTGFYEIFFGDDLIGKKPADKSIVVCEYLTTSGSDGNGALRYFFNTNTSGNHDIIQDIEVIDATQSHGGKDEDSMERTRFLLANNMKKQNRLVVASDYRTEIIDRYGSIETINVWGGEKNHNVQYGKLFISAKPRYAEKLNSAAKQHIIKNVIREKAVVATDVVFVDPEFIDVQVQINAVVDQSLTNKSTNTLEVEMSNDVSRYGSQHLGIFNTILSNSELINNIKRKDTPYIVSCYANKTFSKTVDVIPGSTSSYSAIFGNPVDVNTPIYTNFFKYGTSERNYIDAQLRVIGNSVYLVDKQMNKVVPQSFGSLDATKKNAVVQFTLPKAAKLQTHALSINIGSITWNATPKNPDIFTYNNNIVRITKINIVIDVHGVADE